MIVSAKGPLRRAASGVDGLEDPILHKKRKVSGECRRRFGVESHIKIRPGIHIQGKTGGWETLRIAHVKVSTADDCRRSAATFAGAGIMPLLLSGRYRKRISLRTDV